jgi:proteic killer suppression protein
MRVVFADERLQRICTDEAHKLGLPIAIVKMARKRLVQLEAAADERDLYQITSLHYKKLGGDKEGLRSIRVNDQYRIEFRLDDSERPAIICITTIGDTH